METRTTLIRRRTGVLFLVWLLAAGCWCLGYLRWQKCVTRPAAEPQYVAMADGVKEALYVRGMLAFWVPSVEVGEHLRVRGQQGGERLSEKSFELV